MARLDGRDLFSWLDGEVDGDGTEGANWIWWLDGDVEVTAGKETESGKEDTLVKFRWSSC